MTSARTEWVCASSSARACRRSLRRATSVRPWPRRASSRAMSAPMPDEAPVTIAVVFSLGGGSAMCQIVRDLVRPTPGRCDGRHITWT